MSASKLNRQLADANVVEQRMDLVKNHRALYARRSFKPGDVISEFSARKTFSKPTYLTVQISDTAHIELFPDYLECVNHSCDPNSFFDTSTLQFIALKQIDEGDEFFFFYPSSEWDMDQPFKCHCGEPNCLGTIRGAKHLDKKAVATYRFTDYIKGKLGI
ncbi:MAG TPA: SET domain-containing protein-lysine N-methyltransferase [Cyclobacteriaceae bacterium]|nr:SET domain-containing protein-lysine N-methyltransferase [Cyclobacteriaceae bacterium]